MTRRWLQIWAAVYAMVLCAAGGALYLLHAALPPESQTRLAPLLASATTLLVTAALLAFGFAGMLAHWVTQRYFSPVLRSAELVQLMAAGNPDYRIETVATDPAELVQLSHAINQLAARTRQVQQEVEQRISEVNNRLTREKGHLAALLSDLAQSVIVCNAEGRVLLYNEQTRLALGVPSMQGRLGLGRSLYDLLEREIVTRGYAALRGRLQQGDSRAVSEFTVRLYDGRSAHVRMAPVRHDAADTDANATAEGFVLLLTEISDPEQSAAVPALPAEELRLAGRPVYYDFDLFHQPGQTREIDDRPLRELSCTVFDTETTGLDPGGGDEIIAIGAVRIVNGRLLPWETYQQLIDPRRALHPDSIRIHGVTPDKLAGKPTIVEVLPVFHRFCEGTLLVGHNAAFDMRFLELKEAAAAVRFDAPVLDTMLLSAALHGNRLEHRLEDIAARVGVPVVDRHTALGDAVTTARVFLKLIDLLSARGIVTLREARAASARTLHARIRY